MQFQFGIEHEVAFLNAAGKFADFTNTTFEMFDRIIQKLPYCDDDAIYLRSGDSGIRKKRWYIEGFERFSAEGQLVDCLPKGIEIRTSVYAGIDQTIGALTKDYDLLVKTASDQGFSPIPISFNPIQTAFVPNPPLNAYECAWVRVDSIDDAAGFGPSEAGAQLSGGRMFGGSGGNFRGSIADRSGKSHGQQAGNLKVKNLLSLRQRHRP
jgi:hypothetical protein